MRGREPITLAALCLGVLLPSCGSKVERPPEGRIVLLTASEQGYYHKVGQAIKQVVTKQYKNFEVEPTEGSKENLDCLSGSRDCHLQFSEGTSVFAIVQSDAAHCYWYRDPPFDPDCKDECPEIRLVAPLFTEKVHAIIRPHLYASEPAQLRGKRLWLGRRGSGTRLTAERVLQAAGLDDTDYSRDDSPKSFTDAIRLLKRYELDAAFLTVAAPTEDVRQALHKTEVKLLGFDWDLVQKLVADGTYIEASFQKSTYDPLSRGVYTVGVQALLVTRRETDPNAVRLLSRTLRYRQQEVETALEAVFQSEEGTHAHTWLRGPRHPVRLTLLGVQLHTELHDRAHEAGEDFLWDWPLRKGPLVSLAAIVAALIATGLIAAYSARARRRMHGPSRAVLLVWVALLCFGFGAVLLQAVEGELNPHFTTLWEASRSLALNMLASLQLPVPNPIPTTTQGQTVLKWITWIQIGVLSPFLWPLAKALWSKKIKKVRN